jgi:hypothetical protein
VENNDILVIWITTILEDVFDSKEDQFDPGDLYFEILDELLCTFKF